MKPEEATAALVELTRKSLAQWPLGKLLTSDHTFGLTTATPLQRAICDLIEGLELGDAHDQNVIDLLGGRPAPERPAKEILLLCGVRVAKSIIAACLAIRWSQTCDLGMLQPGEVPRIPIVSLRRDNAQVVMDHLRGAFQSSEVLRSLLWEPLEDQGSMSLLVRHPTNRPVEISIVAGSKAGGSLVSRWLAGIIFDEAPRMIGQEDGVVNLDDAIHAVSERMLPGSQIAYIGSPFAPFGPVYHMVQEAFGQDDPDRLVLWCRRAELLNPYHWTEDRIEALKIKRPEIYRTDYAAGFLGAVSQLYPEVLLQASTRKAPAQLPPRPGAKYIARIDPATRGNAWTLAIATREGRHRKIALLRQWQGNQAEPLKPREVFKEIAAEIKPYGLTRLHTDQWATDALRDSAKPAGLVLIENVATANSNTDSFLTMRDDMADGEIELAPDAMALEDLRRVQKVNTSAGPSIKLPKTGDGRHCDFAPVVVGSLTALIGDYEQPEPEIGTNEWKNRQDKIQENKEADELDRGLGEPWWRGGSSHRRSFR